MSWKKLLESVSGPLNDHIQLRNDYLMAENRILRNQINGRVQLTDNERRELAEIGAKLGKKALAEIATIAQPDTILAWNRKFATPKADTSEPLKSVGRPRVDKEIEDLVIRMARENRSWGYDRIQGALKHLGYTISDQTVGNILKRHSISPAPERKKTVTWREFVRSHLAVLLATDFFNSEVWSWLGLAISYLMSFILFSRHQVQTAKTALHQQMLVMQCLMHSSLNWSLHTLKWTRLSKKQSQVRQSVERGLEPTLLEDTLADMHKPQLQNVGRVIYLSTACISQIRDGPLRAPLGDLLKDCNHKAA